MSAAVPSAEGLRTKEFLPDDARSALCESRLDCRRQSLATFLSTAQGPKFAAARPMLRSQAARCRE